ncbi:hypothetical protein [Olleya sp. 1-3]|nr:hypothetical protein [Olleya sp. 1-3]
MKTIPTRTNLSALNDQKRKTVLSTERRELVLARNGTLFPIEQIEKYNLI